MIGLNVHFYRWTTWWSRSNCFDHNAILHPQQVLPGPREQANEEVGSK
jgi:hypothetical protein